MANPSPFTTLGGPDNVTGALNPFPTSWGTWDFYNNSSIRQLGVGPVPPPVKPLNVITPATNRDDVNGATVAPQINFSSDGSGQALQPGTAQPITVTGKNDPLAGTHSQVTGQIPGTTVVFKSPA
jgi:hypothetical protein